LIGQSDAFIAGAHASLMISAGLLLAAAAAMWCLKQGEMAHLSGSKAQALRSAK
jgi:hypothetical protein